LVRDAADVIGNANPVVFIETEADASEEDNNGVHLDGVELSFGLLCTDDEGDELTQHGGFVLLEVRQPPAEARAVPDVAPEGEVSNEQVNARLEQLRDVQSHFTQWVRNSLPIAEIQVFTPYECVVTHDGRLFHTYVYWEGA
jgi:hypothetical protein